MQQASAQQKYETAIDLRNQIDSIRLVTEHQIVDNERRFDQDILAFKQVGDKMLAVQMGVRKGVLLGKKQFSVDLQPQVEQEFLKAYYASNRIPREILLEQACVAGTRGEKSPRRIPAEKRGCTRLPDNSQKSRQTCAG